MSTSNTTCYKVLAQNSPSLFQNGKLVLQTYHIGWILAGSFATVSTVISLWLINKHLQWYTCKSEQRYIVRILFLVPLYAIISFGSFVFWNHSTPLLLIRDAYESIVLTAFFYLLLIYLSPDLEEQKSIFLRLGLSQEADKVATRKGQQIKKWIFPLGFVKRKPTDGLYFLQLMKWGVLQYCVIRPTTTFIAVILDYMGLYCEESWGLGWGHIYISTIVSISVTLAMYCLLQLYVPVKEILAPHKPLLKLFAIKAVIFLTFWQGTFLSLLGMLGVVKATKYMTATDVNNAIGCLLETFEMMLFALLHLCAFSYKPYRSFALSTSTGSLEKTPCLRSLGHAMDFRETFREIWGGCLYIIHKVRGQEPTSDVGVKRNAYFREAFGRQRTPAIGKIESTHSDSKTKPGFPNKIEVEDEVDIDVAGGKQWLGLGDNGLRYSHIERSDGSEIQISRELERHGYIPDTRGYPATDTQGLLPANADTGDRRQRSLWTSFYDRCSQSNQESHWGLGLNPASDQSPRPSNSLHPRPVIYGDTEVGLLSSRDLDDPPPPSVIRTHHGQHRNPRAPTNTEEDVLAPLPVLNKRPPKNRQRFKSPQSTSHHVNAPTLGSSDGSRTRGSISVSSFPIQTPAGKDSLFGRVFPSGNRNNSHGTITRDFDIPYSSLEESSRARNTTALMSPTGVDRQFGVACESVASQTQLGSYQMPNGLTAQVVHFPPLEPAHETSKSSRSDSWHRREAAFLHPPFPFSSVHSDTPFTPAKFSNASSGSHNPVQ